MRSVLGMLAIVAASVGAPYGAQALLTSGPVSCGGQRNVWRAAYVASTPPARCAHAIGTVALPHGTAAFHT